MVNSNSVAVIYHEGKDNELSSKTNIQHSLANVLLGSVNLQLGLESINYPTKYNVMFYSAESFKSNEVTFDGYFEK